MSIKDKKMEEKFLETKKAMEDFGLCDDGVDTIFHRFFPVVEASYGGWDHITDSYEQMYIIKEGDKFYKFGYTYYVCYWNEVEPIIDITYIDKY